MGPSSTGVTVARTQAALRLAEAKDALGEKAAAKVSVMDARFFECVLGLNPLLLREADVVRERKRREDSLGMWAPERAPASERRLLDARRGEDDGVSHTPHTTHLRRASRPRERSVPRHS